MRWCWVNFQCRGVLLIWLIVGQGPTALAVGASRGRLDIFTLIYLFSPLSPSLWETARYRLKYCLKGPLNPKQPTNQPTEGRQRRKTYIHAHTKHHIRRDMHLLFFRTQIAKSNSTRFSLCCNLQAIGTDRSKQTGAVYSTVCHFIYVALQHCKTKFGPV